MLICSPPSPTAHTLPNGISAKILTMPAILASKCETLSRIRSVPTITRVVPNDLGHPLGGEVNMQDRFGLLAQIVHKPFLSSILKFNGVEVKTKDYFRKEGLGVYGR